MCAALKKVGRIISMNDGVQEFGSFGNSVVLNLYFKGTAQQSECLERGGVTWCWWWSHHSQICTTANAEKRGCLDLPVFGSGENSGFVSPKRFTLKPLSLLRQWWLWQHKPGRGVTSFWPHLGVATSLQGNQLFLIVLGAHDLIWQWAVSATLPRNTSASLNTTVVKRPFWRMLPRKHSGVRACVGTPPLIFTARENPCLTMKGHPCELLLPPVRLQTGTPNLVCFGSMFCRRGVAEGRAGGGQAGSQAHFVG